MKIRNLINYAFMALLTLAVTACGGDAGGEPDSDPGEILVESNPEFIAKSEAVAFNRINLYKGHASLADRDLTELDVGNLSSGELITINIEFEVSDTQDEYVLSVELIPESVIDSLKPGDTFGEISDNNLSSLKDVGNINLGNVHIDSIKPGLLNAIIHAKLPTLGADKKYRIVVAPSLAYLALEKEIVESDAYTVPLLIDDRTLSISKLEKVSVKVINLPALTKNNEFTSLEIGGEFDADGYSIDPLFQTSIQVDLSTFNQSEKVSLSLIWVSPSGIEFPLGLLGTNSQEEPIIANKAQFNIDASDSAFVNIPVVAYAPIKTQVELLKQSIDIKDIADQNALNAEFSLQVFYEEDGSDVSAGTAYSLSLPLVRQSNRVIENSTETAVGFKILRAGPLNNACLIASGLDVDTRLFANDSVNTITAVNCPTTGVVGANMLWRYDAATKHIISKVTDLDGNNYCVAIFGSNGLIDNDYHLVECQYATGIRGMPVLSQRYNFEGNKIKAEGANGYLGVIFSGDPGKEVQIQSVVDAPDFFTNANGLDLSATGRLFYAGKFDNRTWGNEQYVSASLSYGGESFVDYFPILGSTSQGHVTFSGALFGKGIDIIDLQFALKKHFPKKLSFTGQNSPDVDVENGALFSLEVAGFEGFTRGSLTQKTITETYSPQTLVGVMIDEVPDFQDIEVSPEFLVEEDFIDFTYWGLVIPIEIKGGINSGVAVTGGLISPPGVGLNLTLVQSFTIGGFLSAKADIWLASAALTATVELLSQELEFVTGGGFEAALPPQNTALSLAFSTSLHATLKALKADLSYVLDYPSFWNDGHDEGTLYSTPGYLFNPPPWYIYADQINGSVINY